MHELCPSQHALDRDVRMCADRFGRIREKRALGHRVDEGVEIALVARPELGRMLLTRCVARCRPDVAKNRSPDRSPAKYASAAKYSSSSMRAFHEVIAVGEVVRDVANQ